MYMMTDILFINWRPLPSDQALQATCTVLAWLY